MRGLIIRWLILTVSILLAAYLIDGIRVGSFLSAVLAAAVLSILNALLRPLLIILTLPLNILTLGLFTFLINAFLLKITSSVIHGFDVTGFWPAVIGALVISVVNWLLGKFISDTGRVDYIDLRRKGGRWE
ncbi:MAG: phage holin family protein [Syntrophales bacterium]|nr:phage holin family protein [Syntrophales bacterium]